MATWKRVITTNDDSDYKNESITLAQLDAGLDSESNYGANKILKVNSAGNAIEWADDSGGIALTDLSVGSEGTASGDGSIAYNNSSGVFTYTPPVLTNLPNQAVDTTSSPSWVDGTFTGGDLYVKGGESSAATLYLYADQGDDADDKWSITTGTQGGSLAIKQNTTTEFSIASSGLTTVTGDLVVGGNDIKGNGGGTCMTLNGTAGSVTFTGAVIAGSNNVSGGSATFQGGDLIVKTSANAEVFKIDNTDGGVGTDTGTMTGDFVVTGNLTVSGTTTTIDTTELNVSDNNIVLNSDLTGTTMPSVAGIEIERGDYPNVKLQFSESSNQFFAAIPNHSTDGSASGVVNGTLALLQQGTAATGNANRQTVGDMYIKTDSSELYIYM